MKTFFSVSLVYLLSVFSIGYSFPKPAAVQADKDWTLNVGYNQPQQISVTLPGQSEPQRFWYLIISLTNNSFNNEEVPFFPYSELVTDTFKTQPAGKGVQKTVFNMIKLKHQGQYPFLESLDFADHRIRHGQDNTRDICVIWSDFCPKARQISLFLGGLSNETIAIAHPTQKDDSGNPKRVYLQKTLQLTFAIAGDEQLRQNAGLKFLRQDWVMR